MVNIEKLKQNLKQKYGDQLEAKIKEVMESEGCNERIAIYQLGNKDEEIEVPVSSFRGEFSPQPISEIKGKMLDIVNELEEAGVQNIDQEMRQKGMWVGLIAMTTGLAGRIESYETKADKRADIKRRVGFIDPTGYIEGTIWKGDAVELLADEFPAGKIVGLSTVITNYFHRDRKVGLNLSSKTEVLDVPDKIHSGWLRNIDEIDEFDACLTRISDVGKPSEHAYKGCSNPVCPQSFKGTSKSMCNQCGTPTEDLVSKTYPAIAGEDVFDFSVPAWTKLDLNIGGENIVAVRRRDNNGEKQFTVLAVIDPKDMSDDIKEDWYHVVDVPESSNKSSSVSKAPVQPEVKIDTTNIEVDKKQILSVKNMIKSVQRVDETEIVGIAKTMELKPEVVAKCLDELISEDVVSKEGSTWKLKSS